VSLSHRISSSLNSRLRTPARISSLTRSGPMMADDGILERFALDETHGVEGPAIGVLA
jgi:hypothetical protein